MENKIIEEIARKERIEYLRKWRAKNKDKVRQHNKNYWEKRARKRFAEEGEDNGNKR